MILYMFTYLVTGVALGAAVIVCVSKLFDQWQQQRVEITRTDWSTGRKRPRSESS